MKKVTTCIAVLLLASATFAQEGSTTSKPKTPEEVYNTAWEKAATSLNLSAEQQKQWQSLNKAYAEKQKAVLTNTSLTAEEKQSQMKAIQSEKQAELQNVLTKDQYAKFTTDVQTAVNTAKAKATEKGTLAKEKGQEAYAAGWDNVASDLGLSAKQEEQWKNLNKEYAQKQKDVLTNTSLTKEEKQSQMKAINEEKQASLQGILTEEQYTQHKANISDKSANIKTAIQGKANNAKAKMQEVKNNLPKRKGG